jgi:hypothetical protein
MSLVKTNEAQYQPVLLGLCYGRIGSRLCKNALPVRFRGSSHLCADGDR